MSEDVIEYKQLIDNDPTLSKNDLSEFYEKFSRDCEKSNTEGYCNDDMGEDLNGSAKDIFKKLIRNINELIRYNGIYNEKYINKLCIYLKYWFYDKILTKNIDYSNIGNFFDALSQYKGEDTSESKTCEFYQLKLTEIKDIKKLYDYFMFFDGYNSVKSTINDKNIQ
ncbi:VIR-like CYIR protein [Plasmodium cynomolgi strain B]|uniref:VIR-like CYIR protein n=1 Tax=Plasmodium cynomolgi (strain B) TaxID=1120755 RepID=K6UDR9_PLACD|nr:VIR-like CYIR protein [Plasmodium cynomolgi strain B]GAB67081.1 VIR-like CYIR protein [Plasmodium cynomolgi strain B]